MTVETISGSKLIKTQSSCEIHSDMTIAVMYEVEIATKS